MIDLCGPLSELTRTLDALGARVSPVDLVRAVEKTHLTAADVAAFVRPSFQSYNRTPVVVREHYEMLVLTWQAGQGSAPHEHSGSVCVVRVVQGQAAEGSYSVATDGFVDLEYEELVRAGEITSLHDAGVHVIRNASADGETLVTLHVYSPPLREGRRFVPRPEPQRIPHKKRAGDIPTIAIVGGGFSGSMTAAHILRDAKSPLRVVVIERRGSVGEGVAYATRESAHLLNVGAANMSAWESRPQDFTQWALGRSRDVQPSDFLPRQWYGDYIRDTLHGAAKGAEAELSIVFDEVRRVAKKPEGGWMLHLARGSSLHADAVVLAIGHCAPADPIGAHWLGPRTRFITDPWRPFAMNAIRGDEPIVVLGSGLTAVDTVISLTEYPRSAKITLVSVNGLIPQGHAEFPTTPADLDDAVSTLLRTPGGVTCLRLLRGLRRLAHEFTSKGSDWRSVVDGLRPHTASLWRAMSLAQRRRFLARLRPFWEVHRHRTAPEISTRLRSLLESGRVEVIAGRVESVREERDQVCVRVRARKSRNPVEITAGWVVNCTGPLPSNRPESNPAIGSLMVRGQLSLDALALGVETGEHGNAIAANGSEVPDIFVVGTLRKPALWESTAVPELRQQAAEAAERLLEQFTADQCSSARVRAGATHNF
jgi:uncharacterized NAD(P)/FAD-binding protein YdhS/predicted metal-dependent enzyme (double-stranded beta helix superfamily)